MEAPHGRRRKDICAAPCQIQILTIWPSVSWGQECIAFYQMQGVLRNTNHVVPGPIFQVMSGPVIIISIARANSPIHRLNAAAFCNCFLPSPSSAAFYSTFFISLADGHRLCWQRGLACIFSCSISSLLFFPAIKRASQVMIHNSWCITGSTCNA